MTKGKRVGAKRVRAGNKSSAKRSTHLLRGVWEHGSLNLSQYRLVLGCSLETRKK
jgi:hypothetical protein